MTARPAPRLGPLGPDDRDAVVALDQWAFAYDDSETDMVVEAAALEWDRLTGAWLPGPEGPGAGEELAGMCGVYSLRMSLPGAGTELPLLPVAGLTWVGVHPQFRRRGVMTALLTDHVRAVAAAGTEAVSVLFAAEAAIYGRFGYGLATRALTLTIGRGAAFRDVPGSDDVAVRIEKLDVDRHTDLIAGVLERTAPHRPGTMTRPSAGLRRLALVDDPRGRHGRESLRVALATVDGQVRGYAVLARESRWSDAGNPEGVVHVRELQALDAATEAALWRHLADLDLTVHLRSGRRPVDDRLLHLLKDPRAAAPTLVDGQYVRIVDLPRALAARRYAHRVDVVLEVTDELLPANAGRWHLRGGPDGAACEPTTNQPSVRLGVRELGAAYLGGESLAAMGDAGLLQADDPAPLADVASAFSSALAPSGCWVF